jgi:RNA polymerase sigma-70 factor, ECF subfamily
MNARMAPADAALQLFDLYADKVFEFAKYSLNNRTEAEDVVQEVFLRVLRHWDRVQNQSDPKVWLWTVARNCIRDAQRRHYRNREHAVEDMETVGPTAKGSDSLVEVEDILRELPEAHREVVYLRLLEDLSTEQTARILGCPAGRVRATLHRAVKTLRETLRDDAGPVALMDRGRRTY